MSSLRSDKVVIIINEQEIIGDKSLHAKISISQHIKLAPSIDHNAKSDN